jgi:hypothetical protein
MSARCRCGRCGRHRRAPPHANLESRYPFLSAAAPRYSPASTQRHADGCDAAVRRGNDRVADLGRRPTNLPQTRQLREGAASAESHTSSIERVDALDATLGESRCTQIELRRMQVLPLRAGLAISPKSLAGNGSRRRRARVAVSAASGTLRSCYRASRGPRRDRVSAGHDVEESSLCKPGVPPCGTYALSIAVTGSTVQAHHRFDSDQPSRHGTSCQ